MMSDAWVPGETVKPYVRGPWDTLGLLDNLALRGIVIVGAYQDEEEPGRRAPPAALGDLAEIVRGIYEDEDRSSILRTSRRTEVSCTYQVPVRGRTYKIMLLTVPCDFVDDVYPN